MLAFEPLSSRLMRIGAVFVTQLSWVVLIPFSLARPAADSTAPVRRLSIEWTGKEKGSAAVRDRFLHKLKSSGKMEIVSDPASADAAIHGLARIWISGYISTSPRSRGIPQPTYQGFASIELVGKDNKTLWSYLATPNPGGWKSITDDLGDQLAQSLLEVNASQAFSATAGPPGTLSPAANPGILSLKGAGATFPGPIYRKWFENFQRSRSDIQIQYQPVGSQEGLRLFLGGSADFAASEMPLSDQELADKPEGLRQFATVLGAVVPIYNLKDAPDDLNLTPEILAGIYLGKIVRWNDPVIHASNSGAHLPDSPIQVIHRSDGSGTTFVFTDYLAKVSPEWKSRIGSGATVSWPVGSGAEHNEGVAEAVYQTPDSIGYVEFIYALQHELSFAAVRNASGVFLKADLDSVTAAAKSVSLPANNDFRFSITNAPGKHTYPISSFTWLVIPLNSKDPLKKSAMLDLLRWILTTGQKQCSSLGYSPLPPELAAQELQSLPSR